MPWPTPQDYNEAVQNPPYAFSDPELQAGACETTALGLPKPITGNFASVYRLQCGGRDWAVRCFWRDVSDMQVRYCEISAHLSAATLPYTVGFEYQPSGIRIKGTWYPILKMEWVEGLLLNDYIVTNLHDSRRLGALLDRWVRLVGDLERAGCAHGDLQHGNVLVVGGEFKLVDYDGMYVPALRGMGSHELGQQHYQHPRRGAADFGPHLDRFSAWVISLSLEALRADPSLWTALEAGDERLLLRRQDFEDPSSSPALALLAGHSDPSLRARALQFRALLDGPVDAVPPLTPPRGARASVGTMDTHADLWHLPSMLVRIVIPTATGPAASPSSRPEPGYPAWVVDHLPSATQQVPPGPAARVRSARVLSLAGLALTGTAFGVLWMSAVVSPAAVALLLLLFWSVWCLTACVVVYRRDPAVQRLTPLVLRESVYLLRLVGTARSTSALSSRAARVRCRIERADNTAAARRTALERRRDSQADEARQARVEADEDCRERLRAIDRRAVEVADVALQELRHRHVGTALRRASLRRAAIRGVGPLVKARLWAFGIWAAADLSSERIGLLRRMQHAHLTALVEWRVDVERVARRTAPGTVPEGILRPILQRHATERTRVEKARAIRHARADARAQDAAERFDRNLGRLEDRLATYTERQRLRQIALEERALAAAARREECRNALEAVRRDIAEIGEVRFGQFVRSVYLPGRPYSERDSASRV